MSDKPLKFGAMPDGEPKTKAAQTAALKLFSMLVSSGLGDRIHSDLLRYIAKGVAQYAEGETPWKLKQGKAPKRALRRHAQLVFEAHILPQWRSILETEKPLQPTAVARSLGDDVDSCRKQAARATSGAVNDPDILASLQPELARLAAENGLPQGEAFVVNGTIRWMTPEQSKLYFDDVRALVTWLKQRQAEADRAIESLDREKAIRLLDDERARADWEIEMLERRSKMMEEALNVSQDVMAAHNYLNPKNRDRFQEFGADVWAEALEVSRQLRLAMYAPLPKL